MEQKTLTKQGMQKIAATRAKLAFLAQDLSKEMVAKSIELDHFLLKVEELQYFACRGIMTNPVNFTVTEVKLPEGMKPE